MIIPLKDIMILNNFLKCFKRLIKVNIRVIKKIERVNESNGKIDQNEVIKAQTGNRRKSPYFKL
jgi:hypothetical protein